MRPTLVACAAALVALAAPQRADAYPQFQFSSGTARCASCHFSPSGGGLLNDWGRGEAGDTLSRGGDGGFLHGAVKLPPWLALGADARLAVLANDVGDPAGVEPKVFPMQADAYGRLAGGGFSLNLTGGLRGQARPADGDGGTASRLVSREHYLMWKPEAQGLYVRAGRFLVPYGLRVAEHVSYTRRRLDANILQEPYAASVGWSNDAWEGHLSAFVPDMVQHLGAHQTGGALLVERRLGETASVGAQARVAMADASDKQMGGVTGKVHFERARLLLMGEGDLVREVLTKAGDESRLQAVGYLGATFFPVRGLLASLILEHFDEDLAVRKLDRDALNLQIQLFPWAHCEVLLLGRIETIGLGGGGDTARLAMLQLHYYL